jgi:uncharacterized membrane protein YeaQ/YmgE (transglycosylase-associated protein family)
MGIISWIVLGGLAGWAATLITGRGKQYGCLSNIIIGIVGAFLGGVIMSWLGHTGVAGFNMRSFAIAVLGAVALLLIVGLFRGGNRR